MIKILHITITINKERLSKTASLEFLADVAVTRNPLGGKKYTSVAIQLQLLNGIKMDRVRINPGKCGLKRKAEVLETTADPKFPRLVTLSLKERFHDS